MSLGFERDELGNDFILSISEEVGVIRDLAVAALRFCSPTWPSPTEAPPKSRAYFLPDCRYFDEKSSGVSVSERQLVCMGVKTESSTVAIGSIRS
jgi:hypothetical protein